MQINNNTLYYIYDPMCSWCYAFEQTFAALIKQLPPLLTVHTVLGGLAKDSQTPMPAELQTMIKKTWQSIENTVPNIHFNYDFWQKNTPLRSTYPACRAVLAAEQQGQNLRHAIQNCYYQQAQNPSLDSVLLDCAKQNSLLNFEQFKQDFYSPLMATQLQAHIALAQQLNTSSYPALRLVLDDTVYTLPLNYTQTTPTLNRISHLITEHKKHPIKSPCQRKCCLNQEDMCLGCFRLLDEITQWSQLNDSEKQIILDNSAQRKQQYEKP